MVFLSNKRISREIKNMHYKIKVFNYAKLDKRWHGNGSILLNDLIYMVVEGEADIWSNDEQIHMTPGNIYVIPSGTRYACNCSEYCAILYFYGNLLNHVGESIPIAKSGCIILPNRTEQILQMCTLYQNNDYHSAWKLKLSAEQLISEAMDLSHHKIPLFEYSPYIQEAIEKIASAPHLSLTTSSIAKELNISTSHLRNLVAKEMNMTLSEYVRQKVLIASTEDLRKEHLSIKEIAEKYGFCDQFYFSRLFTAQFGISPSKYRKEQIF